MLFKKGELSHLWPYYLSVFIEGLSMMIFPFIVLYYKSLGFSYFQISVITSAYGISVFLFELPTGAFADGFSRKYSVLLGFLIVAIAVVLIPLSTQFYTVAILWFIIGIGTTFFSGAEEAWVIDNLNTCGRMDLHQEYFIKHHSFHALGAIFSPIFGAIIVKVYSIKILWYVYATGFLLSALIIFSFTKEYRKKSKLSMPELLKRSYHNSRMGFVFTIKHKVVAFTILGGLFMQLMFIGSIGIQPFLVSLGMPKHEIGYLYAISASLAMVASFASRLFLKFKPKNVISTIILIMVILNLCLSFIYPPFFLLACIIFIFNDSLNNLGMPIIRTYLHQFIPERIRATTLSVKSMADQLVIALTSILAGVLLDLFGPQKVLTCVGLFGLIAIFFFQKIRDQKNININ